MTPHIEDLKTYAAGFMRAGWPSKGWRRGEDSDDAPHTIRVNALKKLLAKYRIEKVSDLPQHQIEAFWAELKVLHETLPRG